MLYCISLTGRYLTIIITTSQMRKYKSIVQIILITRNEMITSEHIRDLSLPKDKDYSKPEDVKWRIDHDLALRIGGLLGERYVRAADELQVKTFANDLPELHARLLASVVADLEQQGISAERDISPPVPGIRLPEGYVRLNPPLTAESRVA